MQQWCVGVWLVACLGTAATAWAGPWEARSAQGLTVRIEQDVARTRDAYVLERRYPDGTADPLFGQQGSLLFRLGPDNEGPAALRIDPLSRIWVAGASVGADALPRAVVLRFAAEGAVDASYAQGGRSAVSPAGRGARAMDLMPAADGSAWVVGLIVDAQGRERSGWWRLRPDGQVDPRFGDGGLWTDPSPVPSEVVELAVAPDGSLALGLRRGEGASGVLEAWVLAPGGATPSLQLVAPNARDARLVNGAGRWQWHAGARELPGRRPSAEAPSAPASASHADRERPDGAPPHTVAVPAPPAGAGQAEPAVGLSWGVVVVAVLALLLAGVAGLRAWRKTSRT